jgi:hypothetical protein
MAIGGKHRAERLISVMNVPRSNERDTFVTKRAAFARSASGMNM